MIFRYLNAADIDKFTQLFGKTLAKKIGFSEKEIKSLSKMEFNEAINAVFGAQEVAMDSNSKEFLKGD